MFGPQKCGRADTVVVQNTGGPLNKHRGDRAIEEINSLVSIL